MEAMCSGAAVVQIPTWAKAMGYRQATCSQLARMSTLPVLHFWGTQVAVKELSASTCLKVGPWLSAATPASGATEGNGYLAGHVQPAGAPINAASAALLERPTSCEGALCQRMP